MDALLQVDDGVQFAFAAVLRRHLVLAAPADVPDEGELGLAQVVLGEELVELFHGQVDDLFVGEGDFHGAGAALVAAGVLIEQVVSRLKLRARFVTDRFLHGGDGELRVLGERRGERQVVGVIVADAVELREAVELGGVLVAHTAELTVTGLVTTDGTFLRLHGGYLGVAAVAHSSFLGEGGRR